MASIEVNTRARIGEGAIAASRAARALVQYDRRRGPAALDELFREGMPPDPPLQGFYRGDLVPVNVAPGLTPLLQWLTAQWMPWQGKTFDRAGARGYNVLSCDSLRLARIFWPGYRHYVPSGNNTFRAFQFRTYVGPGRADVHTQVLKIDYKLRENPVLSVRRLLDELVQVADDYYLGKAHLKWWWGQWQTVAYFTLVR
jgi:hypothetical protein